MYIVMENKLTSKNVDAGREAVIENAHSVISCLSGLIDYPHMMVWI